MELAARKSSGTAPVAFDEMRVPDGSVRPAYAALDGWLNSTPQETLEYCRREAEFIFRRTGITFAGYGEAKAREELWK